MGACSSTSMCQVGALDSTLTHHLSRPPPHHHALPVEDAAGAFGGSFSPPGQDARVSAGPLSAVAWRGLALLALLGPDWGWGAFWVSGPRARSALVWSTAGGACGLAATSTLGHLHCGCRRSHLRDPPLPFSGWRPRLSLRWFSWGPVSWGAPDVWGPDLFHACFMPCGMGLLFPTHTINIYMEEPYEHKRDHTTQVYTQAFTLV